MTTMQPIARFEVGGTVELLESLRLAAKATDVEVERRYHSRFPRYY